MGKGGFFGYLVSGRVGFFRVFGYGFWGLLFLCFCFLLVLCCVFYKIVNS